MTLPNDHPQRLTLNAEIHARPPPALSAPCRISYLVMLTDADTAEQEWSHLQQLGSDSAVFALAPPSYFVLEHADARVIWERHTEFSRYTVICDGAAGQSATALEQLPSSWTSGLCGELFLLAHCDLLASGGASADLALARERFAGGDFSGSDIADGAAAVFTDFDIDAEGSNYCLVTDRGMAPLQAGRNVVRLLEIYTYWLMALLAFPVAKRLLPELAQREQHVRTLSLKLTLARTPAQENELLSELTRLEAEFSERTVANDFRFSAAQAYYDLVSARIVDLREQRIATLQTIGEFSRRRLAPAMQTCRSVVSRQAALSARTSRVARLLATRADLSVQSQNQAVLASLDRRAAVQLRLQRTVEGLSVAAITYYTVGLIKYAADAAYASGLPIHKELVVGLSIPLVVCAVALAIGRVRRRLEVEA